MLQLKPFDIGYLHQQPRVATTYQLCPGARHADQRADVADGGGGPRPPNPGPLNPEGSSGGPIGPGFRFLGKPPNHPPPPPSSSRFQEPFSRVGCVWSGYFVIRSFSRLVHCGSQNEGCLM